MRNGTVPSGLYRWTQVRVRIGIRVLDGLGLDLVQQRRDLLANRGSALPACR